MQNHTTISNGRFFDLRHITMTMAGFIGGPVTAVIAAIIASLYRYNVGGTGLMGGLSIIIIFACFGSILGKHLRNNENKKKPLFWFLIGVVMVCILLLIIEFIIPLSSGITPVFRTDFGLFFIITPLAMTIILSFYFRIYNIFSKALMLDTILKDSPINLVIFNGNGPILVSKNLKAQPQYSQYIDNIFPVQNIRLEKLHETNSLHREIVREDGRHFIADLSGFQMPTGEYACVAVVNDVTDGKLEQEKLKAAKEKFYKAFQMGPHMMAILNKSDNKYVDVNRRYLEAMGLDREELIGKTPIETGVSDNQYKKIINVLEANGSVQNMESSLVMKSGLTGLILSAESIQFDDQECYLLAFNDISEMKRLQADKIDQLTRNLRLEAELSQSNQLVADIIKNMTDAFYVLDSQWRFVFVNDRAEGILQRTQEELLGEDVWELYPYHKRKLCKTVFSKG